MAFDMSYEDYWNTPASQINDNQYSLLPGLPSGDAYGSSIGDAGFLSGLDNFFTGNLDYKRNLETLDISNAFNAAEAEKARQFSSKEAALQRQFEERMSNTAYQRAAADIKAAGYNPALILGAGGASTPSGASASTYAAHSGQGYHGDSTKGWNAIMGGIITLLSRGFMAGVANSAAQQRYDLGMMNLAERQTYHEGIVNSRNSAFDKNYSYKLAALNEREAYHKGLLRSADERNVSYAAASRYNSLLNKERGDYYRYLNYQNDKRGW